ncbi:MAG: peptidoglycan glycosyltransferase, partial [Firmicutes bacterium]|nr:peptidoglycan glycosyltransferase [Bacillota bacterium]
FGLRTGIDLPGESRTDTVVYYVGEDAPYANLQIGPTELATCSFGQGFNTSMIQVASAFSSVINGGYYYQPHVVKKIMDTNGGTVEEMEGNLLRTTISEQTSAKVKQYLYNTMYGPTDGNGNSATGKKARVAGYAMGGKTGTAQKIPRGNGNYLVSFIGYAPYDEPQVVCYVIVDEPNAAYQPTSSFAQEIWKEIMQKSLPYLNIYETEDPPADMIDEYNATHAQKAEEPEEGSEETTSEEKKEDEVIIDPQTGEEVKKPDLSDDPSIDQSTGMLKDLSQDDAYPSEILENVQPSVDETE